MIIVIPLGKLIFLNRKISGISSDNSNDRSYGHITLKHRCFVQSLCLVTIRMDHSWVIPGVVNNVRDLASRQVIETISLLLQTVSGLTGRKHILHLSGSSSIDCAVN